MKIKKKREKYKSFSGTTFVTQGGRQYKATNS